MLKKQQRIRQLSPKTSLLRYRALKLTSFSLFGCFLFLFLIFFFWGNRIAEGTVRYFASQLHSKYGIEVQFDSVDAIGISNISFSNLTFKTENQKTIFSTKRVALTFSLFRYLYKSFPVDSIELESPSLFLETTQKKFIDWRRLSAGLKSLSLKNAYVHLLTADNEIQVSRYSLDFKKIGARYFGEAAFSGAIYKSKADTFFVDEGILSITSKKNPLIAQKIEVSNVFLQNQEYRLLARGIVNRDDLIIGAHFLGEFDLKKASLKKRSPVRINGEVFLSKNLFEVRHSKLEVQEKQSTLSFQMKLSKSLPFTFAFKGVDISLYDCLTEFEVGHAWVDVGIDLLAEGEGVFFPALKMDSRVSGTFKNLAWREGDCRNDQNSLVLKTAYPIIFSSDLKADATGLHFASLDLDDSHSKGMVSLSLYFDPKRGIRLSGKFDSFNTESVGYQIGPHNYRGLGRLTLSIQGDYQNLKIKGETKIRAFSFDDYYFGNISSDFTYQGGSLSFTCIHGKIGKSQYLGDIEINLRKGLFRVEAFSSHFRVADIRNAVSTLYKKNPQWKSFQPNLWQGDLSGLVSFRTDLNRDFIKNAVGKLSLKLIKNGEILSLKFDEGSFELDFDTENVVIKSFKLLRELSEIQAAGSVKRKSGKIDISFESTKLENSWLSHFVNDKVNADGWSNLVGKIEGDLNNPRINAKLHAFDFRLGNANLGNLDLSISLADRVIILQGQVFFEQGFLSAKVDLKTRQLFDGKLSLQFMPLEQIFPEEVWLKKINVSLASEVAFGGSVDKLSKLKGEVTLFPVAVTVGGVRLISVGSVKGSFEGLNLYVDNLVFKTAHQDTLTIKGLISKSSLDLNLKAVGDLWLLPLLDDRIDLAYGAFLVDVRLSGNVGNPLGFGVFELHDGFISFKDMVGDAKHVNLNGTVEKRQAVLKQFAGKFEEGKFGGQGLLSFNNYELKNLDFGLSFQNIPVVTAGITGRGSGLLKFKGDKEAYYLSGNINVLEAFITKKFDLDILYDEFGNLNRLARIRKEKRKPLFLDVHMKGDREIRVENGILNSALELDLVLTGTRTQPVLKGSVVTNLGEVSFRNNRYRLLKGKAIFDNPYRILPRVEIEAEGRVSDYDVNVRLLGPIDKPDYQLNSSPSLSEVDILSLITMGFVGRDVKDSMHTAKTASLEAISFYSGIGQSLVRLLPENYQHSKWFHIDEFKITSIFSQRKGTSIPAIMVGFNLLDGVKLRLHSAIVENTNGVREQSLELEHHLGTNVRWRLAWDSEGYSNYGDAGVDLWYRFSF